MRFTGAGARVQEINRHPRAGPAWAGLARAELAANELAVPGQERRWLTRMTPVQRLRSTRAGWQFPPRFRLALACVLLDHSSGDESMRLVLSLRLAEARDHRPNEYAYQKRDSDEHDTEDYGRQPAAENDDPLLAPAHEEQDKSRKEETAESIQNLVLVCVKLGQRLTWVDGA